MARGTKGNVTWVFEKDQLKNEIVGILDSALDEAALIGADGAVRQIKNRSHAASILKKATPAFLRRQPGPRSKPGQSPTTQSNQLRNSIATTPSRLLRATIGTALEYGKWLELGTSIMGARPWLLRGVRGARKAMWAAFSREALRGFKQIRIRVEKLGR